MSSTMLFVTAMMYLVVAIDQTMKSNLPFAGAFFAYAVANICFIAAMR